jgi:hypothetical protein
MALRTRSEFAAHPGQTRERLRHAAMHMADDLLAAGPLQMTREQLVTGCERAIEAGLQAGSGHDNG